MDKPRTYEELEQRVKELEKEVVRRKRAEEEKKKLEAQHQQAQKMEAIGTLAGGIAHYFNNLLSVIQGNVSLMLFDIDRTHPNYENLKNIEKQVRRGAKLTRQLLGYARKGRYEVKLINLNQLVKETAETFGRTRKEIAIRQDLAQNLFAIEADEDQIEQVLLDLYVNAADAMPGGGDLVLKTTNVTHKDMKGRLYDPKPGKYVLLTVTDTGTGMDKETQERIFDPFFTTKEMGRGLGLASAYGIIKGHGGYIDVDSEKGRGTTFSIYLPASEKEVEKSIKTAKQITKGSGSVLFVDDHAQVLDMGVEVLKRLGYRVLEAKGCRKAVELYKANKDKIDMVILNMNMPDMGGGEAYDRMKEINPNVKVLLSSGYSIDDQAKEILDRGCDGFIQKPFSMNGLSGKIREVLDRN
jgi:nitrogen-specific signal transduction histidine kinase/CheY-like chemotaxis protein